MERFADNESLQALACEALACLSVAPTNRSHMIDASVADLAFVALQKHGTNSTVVSNACKAIAYLIDEGEKKNNNSKNPSQKINLFA